METLSQIHFTAPYWELLLPCIGAGADIVTGWLQATINGTWDSTKMRRGLYRKIGEIMVVVLAWVVGVAIVLPVDIAQVAATSAQASAESAQQSAESAGDYMLTSAEAADLLAIAKGET